MENVEDYLRPDQIAELDGRPIRLSGSYSDGKLLTISPDRRVTLAEDEQGYDQLWKLLPSADGFILSSAKDGNMICHYMEDGGMARIRPLDAEDKNCVWKLGSSGEIYQINPNGGERYLWAANNKLYVTLDGYLAENWIPLSDIKVPYIATPEKKNNFNILIFIVLLVFVCMIVYLLKK